MENTPLHAQKLAILSRLIKADQLTLEEALLLLKGEEEAPVTIQPWQSPTYPGTGSPYWFGSSTGIPTTISNGSSTVTLLNGGKGSISTLTVN